MYMYVYSICIYIHPIGARPMRAQGAHKGPQEPTIAWPTRAQGGHKGPWGPTGACPTSAQGGPQGPGPQWPSGSHNGPARTARVQVGSQGPCPQGPRGACKGPERHVITFHVMLRVQCCLQTFVFFIILSLVKDPDATTKKIPWQSLRTCDLPESHWGSPGNPWDPWDPQVTPLEPPGTPRARPRDPL